MKKLVHLIVCTFAAGTLAAQSIPNGGFESWSPRIWMDPVAYFTSNSQNVPYGFAANVVQTAGYHGTYGVQLTTTKVGSDTLSAYLADGNPTSFPAPGGIPYVQKPTGMRVYYKCNVMVGDTAFVLAIFKKSGAQIGTYIYPITGTVGSYTLLAKTFIPALPGFPDTVIFGATASRILYGNFPGIPGSTLTVDSVTFTGGVSQPLALNGDFEIWQNDTANLPTGWTGVYPTVFQAKAPNVHAGNFALELKTAGPSKQIPQSQPGLATTGNVRINGSGGYPYTLQKDTLTFYYEYAPVGAPDTAVVALQFKKNGAQVGFTSTIMLSQATYTLVSLPFTVPSAPDSVILTFASSATFNNAHMHIGSDLKVDNVQFKSSPLGFEELTMQEGTVKVYPNPVVNTFSINTDGFSGSVQKIAIYDMSGRLIESMNYSSGFGNNIKTFDMSNYANGLYLLHVITSNGNYYQKISKE